MNTEPNQTLLEVYLNEYQKLKDEQIARIGFRDNLIYATLVAIGGLLSYALADAANARALLILPLATFTLGWTFLINDAKISAIGRYIQQDLTERIRTIAGTTNTQSAVVFGWESVSSRDQFRLQRKILQFIVNEALFVGASGVALIAYVMTTTQVSWLTVGIAILESILLILLAIQIGRYAEFRK